MSSTLPDPVLAALLDAAVGATGASQGWLVVARDADLVVVAESGERPAGLLGASTPLGTGTTGYVIGSGQPLALTPRSGDPTGESPLAALAGRRAAGVLCVPCLTGDGVNGVIELIDEADGARFSFDDLELVTLLAGIASVALAVGPGGSSVAVPAPSELAAALERLAATDPERYSLVAAVVGALGGSG